MPAPDTYSADLFGNQERYRPQIRPVHLEPVTFPITTKRRYARPTHFSRIPSGTNIATAVHGAALQGKALFRQGEEVAALLNARRPDCSPLYQQVVVIMPRRATKTTAIWSEIIGRCEQTPGLRVLFTAQDGQRAREILRDDVMENLRDQGFEEKGRGTFRIANGSESIRFTNGSLIRAVPPKPSIFRSKAADIIYLDEAGEYDELLGKQLLAAALPLMDTRPGAQIIISGTPSPGRVGLLWTKLQEGIDKTKRHVGVLAYMIGDDESAIVEDDQGRQTLNRRVLMRVHPGIGTLTTLATIRTRFDDLPLVEFEMEYLCRFPYDTSSTAIDQAAWARCSGGSTLPDRPDRVGLAYDVAPDSSFAALVAAWRDGAGRAHIEVLDARPSDTWLAGQAQRAARKHRAVVAFDSIGANMDTSQSLTRLRTRTNGLSMRHMQGATTRLVREITSGQLRHYNQDDLDDAVAGACWRNVGDGGRLFGRASSTADVCALVAAAAALWQWDLDARRPSRAGTTIKRAS